MYIYYQVSALQSSPKNLLESHHSRQIVFRPLTLEQCVHSSPKTSIAGRTGIESSGQRSSDIAVYLHRLNTH